jgi:L-lactate dehydrogenase complex protein LldE
MANAGCEKDALATYRHYVDVFAAFDFVVSPSGSCVYHVRHHYDVLEQTAAVRRVRERTYELCDFLTNVLHAPPLSAVFPHTVGLHVGCHMRRGLRLAPASELTPAPGGVMRDLLLQVRGLTLVEPERSDECCGFGGTFAITEDAVSARMGQDKVAAHQRLGAEVIASGDVSCLLHLDGVIRKQGLPIRAMHIAEILAGVEL